MIERLILKSLFALGFMDLRYILSSMKPLTISDLNI
jgi:hypothetical protein